jgi:hypothetical protein
MLIDELIEKAFSDGYEYAQRIYSEEKKKRRVRLDEIESHRGLGRASVIGALTGGGALPAAIGGYVGKKYADELDEEGASDKEIITKSGRRAALAGGAITGSLGALATAVARPKDVKRTMAIAGIGTLGSALGAAAGARKNSRERLKKRRHIEDSLYRRDED